VTPDKPLSQHKRVRALMWNMRIDAATGEVVRRFRDRQVESIVLKGPALSEWYPPDSGRTYVDGDVWVAPAQLPTAEAILAELGFMPTIDERGLPDWWQEHASSWERGRDRGKIDLHRKLQGVGLDPTQTWEILWSQRIEFSVGGERAYRLSEAGSVMYATMHATHHGRGDPRGLTHLRAALSSVDEDAWARALALAGQLDALEAFGTGLRLLPEGVALAERLGVPDAMSVRASLLASKPPPVALGFDQLANAGALNRLAIVFRKLVPPPGFIRHWWSPAARNPAMLAVGYLYRPIWLIRRAPAGYSAWRAARRAVKSSS
jgi:Uncharacterised nucleotidyltransferase